VPSAPFVVPPLLLVVLLCISAVAKIRHPDDTASVFRQLELPEFLLRFRAPRLLPYGELVVAALLLTAPNGWYVVAAALALLLFLAFLLVVVRGLRLPGEIRCGCFGELGLGLITPQTVVRNAVLVAVATITFLDSFRGDGVLQRLTSFGDGWWWLAAVGVAMVATAFVAPSEREVPYLVTPGASLPAQEPGGYVAPQTPYVVLDSAEGLVSVWTLTDVAARLLIFCDPSSPDAAPLLDRLPGWSQALSPVVVHVVGGWDWARLGSRHPELAEWLMGDPVNEVRQRLGIKTTTGAVLLGTDRFLAGGPVEGADEVEELVEAVVEQIRAAAAATQEHVGQ
jgi:hypothetical protein